MTQGNYDEMNGAHVAPVLGTGSCNDDSCAIAAHWVGGSGDPRGPVASLSELLHTERTAANTTHADCWACEAAQSHTIRDLETRLRLSTAAASHANAILEKLVPDEERLKEVWKDHWRDVLGLGERRKS